MIKKLLFDLTRTLGYTIIGLIFFFAFFLLFINFYHARELNLVIDVTSENTENQSLIAQKLDKVKKNVAVYSQNTYQGSNSIYDMNAIQIRLNSCIQSFESEEAKQTINKNEVMLKDVYKINSFYQNEILNDCIVMQLNAFTTDTNVYSIPSLASLKPFIQLDVDHLLNSSNYLVGNLLNADSYFFSNDTNRETIFNLVEDIYYTTMQNYQNALDLLVEISNWYYKEVVGG